MKFNGLKCADCGSDLRLSVSHSGMHKKYKWLIALDCTECTQSFEICRTDKPENICETEENI